MAATVLLVVALLLTLTAGSSSAAAVGPEPQMECVCTSTHFADVSFSIKCERNSTGRWDTPSGQDGFSKFFEQSTVSCERGPPPKDLAKNLRYELVKWKGGSGYYKFHPRQTTWEDALRTCALEGANLIVVNSEGEATALAKIFQAFPKLHEEEWLNNQVWVGVTDLKTEGNFQSLTGRSLKQEGYERWADGEPNNDGGNEHCLGFDRQRLYNDEPCDIRLSFICERSASS